MQWMTITSFVPCYAPRVPQHVAVSLFGPLNQIMISSAPSAETDFVYLDKAYPDKQVSIWSFLLLDGLPAKAMSSRFRLETYKLLGELSAKTMSFPCPASFV